MKVAIIGRGLIGGSIEKGLKKALDFEVCNLEDSCDCVVIATPLQTIVEIARNLTEIKKGPLLVLDVGSVKTAITAEFEKLSGDLEFLPTHPMAGSEKSGFENSHEDLFHNRPWVVTPHEKTTEKGLNAAKKLIEALKAKMVLRTAAEHDKQAALISHIPYFLSYQYRKFVELYPEALEMKGPGFESFTRLSFDNCEMHQEIYNNNKDIIIKYLGEFCDQISPKD